MSQFLHVLNTFLNSENVDVDRILSLLSFSEISSSLVDSDLVSQINSNQEILKDPKFIGYLKNLVEMKLLDSITDTSEIDNIKGKYCVKNTYERGITTFPVDPNDVNIISIPRNEKTGIINYHAFLPQQYKSKTVTIRASTKHFTFQSKTEVRRSYQELLTELSFLVEPIDPKTVVNSAGEEIEVYYKYKATLLTSGYKLPVQHRGNLSQESSKSKDMIISGICSALGITFLSPKSGSVQIHSKDSKVSENFWESLPGESYIIIDTHPALKELAINYNQFFMGAKNSFGEVVADFIGLCYFESNDVILVPETFKVFSRHVTKIFHAGSLNYQNSEDIQKYTTNLISAVRRFNDRIRVPDAVTVKDDNNTISISFRNIHFESAKRISGGINFTFDTTDDKGCHEAVVNIMKGLTIYQSTQEIAIGLQPIAFTITSNRFDGKTNIYVNFPDLEHSSHFNGFEDRVFRVEAIISGFLKTYCCESDKSQMLCLNTMINPLTESYEKYDFLRSYLDRNSSIKLLKPQSVTFNRTKYPSHGTFGTQTCDLYEYASHLNDIYSILLFIFAKKTMTSKLGRGKEYSSNINECLQSQVLRTLKGRNDSQNVYLFPNFGFVSTNQSESGYTFDASVYETAMKNSYSLYSFINVNVNDVYLLKKGNDTTIFVTLVEYSPKFPPELADDSDIPMKVIRLEGNKSLYMMSRYHPELKFKPNIHIKRTNVNSTTEINFSSENGFLVANVKYRDEPIINHATLIRFFLESLNYGTDAQRIIYKICEIYDEVGEQSITDLFRMIELDEESSYVNRFFQDLANEIDTHGFNPFSILKASQSLSDSNYWLFSFMNNMLTSLKRPTCCNDYPTFDREIIDSIELYESNNKISSNHAQYHNKVIDIDFIIDIINLERTVFIGYISAIRDYLNMTLVKEDIGSIFQYLPSESYDIVEISGNICVIIDESLIPQYSSNTYVLPHSGASVTFSHRLETMNSIMKDRQLSPLFDAFFELETENDEFFDEVLIIAYVENNIRYQYIDSTEVPTENLISIESTRVENGTRKVVFSLPFEHKGGKMLVSGTGKSINLEEGDCKISANIKLLTKSCYLVFRNGMYDNCIKLSDPITSEKRKTQRIMLSPNAAVANGILDIDRIKDTCWSGLTCLETLFFDPDLTVEDARSIFFMVHSDSINRDAKFTIEIDEVKKQNILLMPSNPYKLYTDMISSGIYREETYTMPNDVRANIELCEKEGLKLNFSHVYKISDILTVYDSFSTYDAPRDMVFVVSERDIVSKVYNEVNVGRSHFYKQIEYVPKLHEENDENVFSNKLDSFKYKFEKVIFDTIQTDRMDDYIRQNIAFSANVPQNGVVYGNVKYSNERPFNSYKFSDNKKALALISDEAVQVFILVGNKYRHISTINCANVEKVSFGGSVFLITSSGTSPEVNNLWIIATGECIDIHLPGYVYSKGDIVDGVITGNNGIPEKKNNITITSVDVIQKGDIKGLKGRERDERLSYRFNSEKGQITNISNANSYNLFYFSPYNNYLIYNHGTNARVIDLNNFRVVTIRLSNGTSGGDKNIPLFSSGNWKFIDGKECFYGISPRGSTFCVTPSENKIFHSEYKFKLPTSKLSTGVYVGKSERSADVNAIFNVAKKDSKLGGMWLYNVYIRYADQKLYMYRGTKVAVRDVVFTNSDETSFDGSVLSIPQGRNVYDELIKSVKILFGENNSVSNILINQYSFLNFLPNADNTDLPVITIPEGEIYVSAFNDEAVCVCYDDHCTTIARYNSQGCVEYTIYHGAGVVILDNILYSYVFTNRMILVELKLPKNIFKANINEEFVLNTVDEMNINDVALVSNNIVKIQYSKPADKDIRLGKSIDDYPISSVLIPYRHNEYELVKYRSVPLDENLNAYPSMEHGNLLLYIVGNELKIIPKVVQKKLRSNDDIPQDIQEEFINTDLREFSEKYESIRTSAEMILATYPEFQTFKQNDTAIYKLLCKDGKAFTGKSFVEFMKFITLSVNNSEIDIDDSRIVEITNEKYFKVMRTFFSGYDVNATLVKLYSENDVHATESYNALCRIAPEMYFLRQSTYQIFPLAASIVEVTNSTDLGQGNFNYNRIEYMSQLIATRLASPEHRRHHENLARLQTLFNLKNFFMIGEQNYGKFNVDHFASFERFRSNIFSNILTKMNAMRTLLTDETSIIEYSLDDLRNLVRDDMIRYYGLSSKFLRGERKTANGIGNDVSICSYSLSCHVPLLYGADEETTNQEVEDLDSILRKNLKIVPENIRFTLAKFDEFYQIITLPNQESYLNDKITELETKIDEVVGMVMACPNKSEQNFIRFIESLNLSQDYEFSHINEEDVEELTISEMSNDQIKMYIYDNLSILIKLRLTIDDLSVINKTLLEGYEVDFGVGNLLGFSKAGDVLEKQINTIVDIRMEKLLENENVVSAIKLANDERKKINDFNDGRTGPAAARANTLKLRLDKMKHDPETKKLVAQVIAIDQFLSMASIEDIAASRLKKNVPNLAEIKDKISELTAIRQKVTKMINNFDEETEDEEQRDMFATKKLILSTVEAIFTNLSEITEFNKRIIDLKKVETNVERLNKFIDSGKDSFNDIILKVCSSDEDQETIVYLIEKMTSSNYATESLLSITGVNTDISKVINPKKAPEQVKGEKIIRDRESKGKLQAKKGEDQQDAMDRTMTIGAVKSEVQTLPVFNVPLYIAHTTSDDEGHYQLMSYHRNTYRVMKAKEYYNELCTLILDMKFNRQDTSTIDRVVTKISDLIKDLIKDEYVLSFTNPIEAYDNLIKQEIYYDVMTMLTDIRTRGVIPSVHHENSSVTVNYLTIISNFLTKIGEIAFGSSIVEMTNADREVSYRIVDEIRESVMEQESQEFVDDLLWLQNMMENGDTETGKLVSLVEFDEFMMKILSKDTDKKIREYRRSGREDLVKKIRQGIYIMRSIRTFAMLTENDLETINFATSLSSDYTQFINFKKRFCEYYNIEHDVYTTPLSSLVSYVVPTYNSNINMLKWYSIYGESPLITKNIPQIYLKYHIPSIMNDVKMNLQKIAWRQYRTVDPTPEQIEMKKLMSSLVADYSKGSSSDEVKNVNEITITFADPIVFSSKHEKTDDEMARIIFEFLPKQDKQNPLDAYDRKSFSISLFDIFQACVMGSSEEFPQMVNSMLDASGKSLSQLNKSSTLRSLFDSDRISNIRYQSVMANLSNAKKLSTCMFGVINVTSKWERDQRINGIVFDNNIYQMSVRSFRDFSTVNGVRGIGTNDFGHNGLTLLSDINVVKNEVGYSEKFVVKGISCILRYFKVQHIGTISTAIEFEAISSGDREIFVCKDLYDSIFVNDGILYVSNKGSNSKKTLDEIKKGSVEVPAVSAQIFDNVMYSNFKQVTEDGYVAIMSNYKSDTKLRGSKDYSGSTIRIIDNRDGSYAPYSNLVFPDLVIKDFVMLPPSIDHGGSLTIVGYSKVNGGLKVRLGMVLLPHGKKNDYIIDSFEIEANMKDEVYDRIDTLKLHGFSISYIQLAARKNDVEFHKVLIWNSIDVSVEERALNPDFPERIDSISVSKSEKYYTVVSGNNSSVYNTFGLKIDNFNGIAEFI